MSVEDIINKKYLINTNIIKGNDIDNTNIVNLNNLDNHIKHLKPLIEVWKVHSHYHQGRNKKERREQDRTAHI